MTLKTWLTRQALILSYLAIFQRSEGGLISLEGEAALNDHHNHHHNQDEYYREADHHISVASSFMHFHGPVEGPEFEVKVPYVIHHTSEHNHLINNGEEHNHEVTEEEGGEGGGTDHDEFHQGYTVDYVAHPKYKFSYGVEDHHTGDFHGQKETRDGSSVSGEYSVKEPGGGVRVVTYRADKDGFHAVVHTSGKNDHSGATYDPDARHQRQGHHHLHQQLHHVQDQGHEEIIPNNSQLRSYAPGYGIHEGYD